MKRILAIILVALMLCCVFVACDEEKPAEETTTAAKTEKPTTEKPTTEEPTTEEPTTDDGLPDLVDVYVDVWNTDNTSHTAVKVMGEHKGIGVAITIPEGGCLYEASVQAPSYSDNIGSLTMKVFVWNTDYATTVAAEPVYFEQFVDFSDNSDLYCGFEEGEIGAGRYLILVCDGVDAEAGDDENKGVGLWTGRPTKDTAYDKYQIESWVDGESTKRMIGKFSLTILELEEQE